MKELWRIAALTILIVAILGLLIKGVIELTKIIREIGHDKIEKNNIVFDDDEDDYLFMQ